MHAILLCFAVGVAGITTQLYLILSNLFPKYSELLSRLLKPDSVALSLSSQLVQAGNYVGGEQVCRRSLDFLPECYKLSVNLAICLAKQERRDEAIKELDKAIIRFPSNQVLLHNRNAILNEAKLNPRFVDAL